MSSCKVSLDLLEDLVRRLSGVNLHDEVLLAVVLHDGHGGLLVGHEALLQRLLVVVGAARAGGAAGQAAGHAGLLVASA